MLRTRPRSTITPCADALVEQREQARQAAAQPPRPRRKALERVGCPAAARLRAASGPPRRQARSRAGSARARRCRASRAPRRRRSGRLVDQTSLISRGYSDASPSPIRYASSPTASSASQITVSTSAVPCGAGAPTSSIPAWRNSRSCPRCGVHAAVAVREVTEAQRRLGVRVARRDHAGDRDGHVRAQRRGPCRSRRKACTRGSLRPSRRAGAPTRTRAPACRPRRSRAARTRRAGRP